MKDAFATLFGRIVWVIVCITIGLWMGGMTASRSFDGLKMGFLELFGLSVASFFFGPGLLVFPLVLLFLVLFIRYEWPLRYALICTLLMTWNSHRTLRWTFYDSPMAKMERQMNEKLSKTAAEAQSKPSKLHTRE